ncbi:MAG: hypothetical protein ACQERG_00840 [Pseudomonadota bacterium]
MGSQLDPADIRALFGAGVARDMRIPAEHLRVAFYDAGTGERLDRHHMRELMGAAPHDGLVEGLFMAEDVAPAGLPMEVPQLVALLDASFLASMRRPPPIDVEFYDQRCGPRGLLGGGISGRVPDEPCRPASSAPAPTQKPATGKTPRAEPATGAATPDPDGWGRLDLSGAEPRPLAQLPRSREAFLQRLPALGLEPDPAPEMESIPLYIQGRNEAELRKRGQAAITRLEEDGRTILRYSEEATELYGDEILVVYVYAYARQTARHTTQDEE